MFIGMLYSVSQKELIYSSVKPNLMKPIYNLLLMLTLLLCVAAGHAQTITEEDGNWSEQYVTLANTSQAELMVRVGDIDNLNFGWPTDFNPFSGNNTPGHGFPWSVNENDPAGTDRIMVVSSYVGAPPYGSDGYTNTTSRPSNTVTPVTLRYDLNGLAVESVIMQIFVDDFQAPVWGASYTVTIDSVRVPFLENIINSLVQTGPIGKMISANVPAEYLYLFEDGEISIRFDDWTTGAGDGFAIDFVKILINKAELGQYSTVTGRIVEMGTNNPLDSVLVIANGIRETYTTSDGTYSIDSIPAGYISIRTYKPGYGSQSKNISLVNGETGSMDFELQTPAPYIVQITPQADSIIKDLSAPIIVIFSQEMDSLTFNNVNIIVSDREKTLTGKITRTLTGFSFQPDSLLENAMTYTVTITSGVKNGPGISLGQDYVWSFKTFDPTLDVAPLSIQDPFEIYYSTSSGEITVTYVLDNMSYINAGIYSIVGVKQLDIENGMKDHGEHRVTINTDNLLNGLYILKVDLGEKCYTKKLIIKR